MCLCRDELLKLSSGLHCVCDPSCCQTGSPVFCSSSVPLSSLWVYLRGGWLVVGGLRAGGTPEGMALHVRNNLGVRLVLSEIHYRSFV